MSRRSLRLGLCSLTLSTGLVCAKDARPATGTVFEHPDMRPSHLFERATFGGDPTVAAANTVTLHQSPDSYPGADNTVTRQSDELFVYFGAYGEIDAARNIVFVEIPATQDGYRPFFNPGGPGPEPFDGVRYTAPGPAGLEPAPMALDAPMRVSRLAP